MNEKDVFNAALAVICGVFKCGHDEVSPLKILKTGMTNHSYSFFVSGKKYIIRMPGEGTDELINRKNEAAAYSVIRGRGICDDLLYIDGKSGIKISAFVEGARVCNPYDVNDLEKCMEKLRDFHSMKIEVGHEFDIFSQIEFYESLRGGDESVYPDYDETKSNVMKLRPYIDSFHIRHYLAHIDAVPDNFLFSRDGIQLIDWEYAGMQDQHVDLAMFCIYSMYESRDLIDRLLDIYFQGHCTEFDRIKIYCYVAACGLLWSNWCEYKKKLGVDFGQYASRQYEYAREYCKMVLPQLSL